jgi:hypothetical protein
MGCIKQIGMFELKVQFPNNLSGVVPITGLCPAYQQLLEMAAKGDTTRVEVGGLFVMDCYKTLCCNF